MTARVHTPQETRAKQHHEETIEVLRAALQKMEAELHRVREEALHPGADALRRVAHEPVRESRGLLRDRIAILAAPPKRTGKNAGRRAAIHIGRLGRAQQ